MHIGYSKLRDDDDFLSPDEILPGGYEILRKTMESVVPYDTAYRNDDISALIELYRQSKMSDVVIFVADQYEKLMNKLVSNSGSLNLNS